MEFENRTDDIPDELPEPVIFDNGEPAPRQRSPRTDPSMRDGDSGHGNPYETDTGAVTTDNDTGDVEDEPVRAGIDGGASEGTPSEMRADVDANADDFSLRAGHDETAEEQLDEYEEGDEIGDAAPAVTDVLPHPRVDAGADGSTIGRNRPAGESPNGVSPPREEATPDEYVPEVDLPIERYSEMTVAEVVEKAGSLSPDDLKRVRDFEAAHRNRKTLLTKLDRLAAGGGRKRKAKQPEAAESSTEGEG